MPNLNCPALPNVSRRGLTLLELMLAMSLMGMLIFAIGMAIDLNLKTLESRRSVIEESQVARSVFRLIAGDLQRVVIAYEQDLSGLESLSAQMAQNAGAAAAALGESGDSSGGDSSGGAGGGNAGSGQSAGGGENAADAGRGEADSSNDTGGDTGGDTATATEDAEMMDETSNTEDIANATSLPDVLGMYGNQYELQMDVSRLPRFDEYIPETPQELGQLVDLPSDVKTVAYYLQPPSTLPNGAGARDPFGDPNVTGGLVRRELDRAVTKWAMESGNSQSLSQRGEIIAPEVVALEFRYFNGLEWLLDWDSEREGGLPMAVEIVMLVRAPAQLDEPLLAAVALNASDPATQAGTLYRTLIRLPTAKPTAGEEEAFGDAGMEDLGL